MEDNEIEEAWKDAIDQKPPEIEKIEIEEGVQESTNDILDSIMLSNEIKNAVLLITELYYGANRSEHDMKLTPLREGAKIIGLHCGYGNHNIRKEELSELALLFRNQNIISVLACVGLSADKYETRIALVNEIVKEVQTNPLQYPKLFPETTKRLISK